MIAIRKKYIAWAGWAVLAIILLTGATVGLAQVADETEEPVVVPAVTILTDPLKVQEDIYIEYDGVAGHDEDDYVGTMDVYDGNGEIMFSWVPYEFPAGVNGAYRISLLQLLNPLDEEGEWVERKVAHHQVTADEPTMFTYGAFGFGEEICSTCPTHIIVWAETYTYDAQGEPVYTPIAGLYSPVAMTTDASIQASIAFVIEIFRPEPEPKDGDGSGGGGGGGVACPGGSWSTGSNSEIDPSAWDFTAGTPNTCSCGGDTISTADFESTICGGPATVRNSKCYCEAP